MKGQREWTKLGYEAAEPRFDLSDTDVDCTGRHCLITGGNKGIGYSAAYQLAKRGAVLHLVCRDMVSAKQSRSIIVSETGNDKIFLYELDLSKPRKVVDFCEQFVRDQDQLHILINNAGVMVHERNVDEDGIEYNFAVNTLAMHLMVTAFVPLLQRSEDSRVISVSSGGMYLVKLDPFDLSHENMQPFLGNLVYSQNKRQQVVLTLNYAQNFDKIHFSCMHPGWVDTLAVRTSLPQFYEAYKDKLRTPEQGADTIVWLAVSKKATTYPSGLFFQDRESVSSHLPLAWTRSNVAEETSFLERLKEITERVRNPHEAVFLEGTNVTTAIGQSVESPVPLADVPSDPEAELTEALTEPTELAVENTLSDAGEVSEKELADGILQEVNQERGEALEDVVMNGGATSEEQQQTAPAAEDATLDTLKNGVLTTPEQTEIRSPQSNGVPVTNGNDNDS